MPKDLYEVLEIERGSSAEDIKKAYFKAARTKHPDKGGSAEEFKEIQRAYETLSDSGRRQMYDMTGSEEGQGGPQMGQQMGGNPFEAMMRGFAGAHGGGGMGIHMDVGGMFEQMFQGGGAQNFFGTPMSAPPQGPPQRQGKGQSKMHEINLSLMDFYAGKDFKIVFNQGRFCYACKGDGVTSFEECSGCGGRGFTTQTMQFQPGFFAQPGDVILILRCPEKGAYSWNGNDLGLEITISWIESVTGFMRTLADHPSGVPKTLSWAGDILLNGAQVRGLGLGMPAGSGGYGDLIITIKVTQPEAGANTKSLLLQALTESQKTTTEGDCILTRV